MFAGGGSILCLCNTDMSVLLVNKILTCLWEGKGIDEFIKSFNNLFSNRRSQNKQHVDVDIDVSVQYAPMKTE